MCGVRISPLLAPTCTCPSKNVHEKRQFFCTFQISTLIKYHVIKYFFNRYFCKKVFRHKKGLRHLKKGLRQKNGQARKMGKPEKWASHFTCTSSYRPQNFPLFLIQKQSLLFYFCFCWLVPVRTCLEIHPNRTNQNLWLNGSVLIFNWE